MVTHVQLFQYKSHPLKSLFVKASQSTIIVSPQAEILSSSLQLETAVPHKILSRQLIQSNTTGLIMAF